MRWNALSRLDVERLIGDIQHEIDQTDERAALTQDDGRRRRLDGRSAGLHAALAKIKAAATLPLTGAMSEAPK